MTPSAHGWLVFRVDAERHAIGVVLEREKPDPAEDPTVACFTRYHPDRPDEALRRMSKKIDRWNARAGLPSHN